MIIFKAPQQEVLQNLQSIAGIVEKRHTIPILANLLIRKQSDHSEWITSDLEIQMRRQVSLGGDNAEGGFTTTVAARKLIDILRTLNPEQVVSLESQQSKLLLKAGKSRFTLQTLPAQDFPLVQEASSYPSSFQVSQKILKNQLQQVAFAMAVQDIRHYLNALLLQTDGKKLLIVSTDGHRLAYSESELETELPKQEVILPRKTVLELLRILNPESETPIEIAFATNQARFRIGELEFISKLVEGKFPDYNRVIPQNHVQLIALSRTAFLASLQRTAIMMSDKFKGVRLNLEPDLLKVAAHNEQEEAMDEIDVDYNGPAIEIGFNVTYLIEVLTNVSEDIIHINFLDSNSSALITVPNINGFKYVVMPMRI